MKTKTKPAKTFSRMTPAEQRVAIAKDVLLWLRAGKLIPSPGEYLAVVDEDGDFVTDQVDHVNGFRCEACALGAIFAVACERSREMRGGHSGLCTSAYTMRDRLAPYFSEAQLCDIETAFERNEISCGGTDPQKAAEFTNGEDNPSTRMRMIMRNIIRHRGTFKP